MAGELQEIIRRHKSGDARREKAMGGTRRALQERVYGREVGEGSGEADGKVDGLTDQGWAQLERWRLTERMEEIERKREAGELPKGIVKDRPTWEGETFGCPEWTGGWIKCESRGCFVMRPANCGRNYCWHCGKKKAAATKVKFREGVLRSEDWKGATVPFMTLTFRARRTKGKSSTRTPETWAKWLNRVENYEPGGKGIIDVWRERTWENLLESISERLDEDGSNSYTNAGIVAEVKAWQYKQLSDFGVALQWTGVLIRGMFNQAMWIAFYNGAFYNLRKCWQTDLGTKLSYVRVIELTQQCVPHLHIAYRLPDGVSTTQIWAWLKESWASIVGDDPRHIQVDAGQNRRGHSVEYSLNYIMKYLMKSYGESRVSWYFNKDRYALTGIENEDDWDKGFRRISSSRDWPVAITGDEDMFHYVADEGEIKQYSRRERYRAYGRMMRAIRNEAIMKTEQGWWDVINDGADEELVKDAYKMILRRKLAIANIREWRTKWPAIINAQVMQSSYKDHGPNWRARGIEQGESFGDWWKPVFEVNGTLYKGIA